VQFSLVALVKNTNFATSIFRECPVNKPGINTKLKINTKLNFNEF